MNIFDFLSTETGATTISFVIALITSLITSSFTFLQFQKKSQDEHITGEREKWREKLRQIAVDLDSIDLEAECFNIVELSSLITSLKVRLNAYGMNYSDFNNDNQYLQDEHIWKEMDNLITSAKCKKKEEFENSKKIIISYLSLLLKYDWEKSKHEIWGKKSINLYLCSGLYIMINYFCYMLYPEKFELFYFIFFSLCCYCLVVLMVKLHNNKSNNYFLLFISVVLIVIIAIWVAFVGNSTNIIFSFLNIFSIIYIYYCLDIDQQYDMYVQEYQSNIYNYNYRNDISNTIFIEFKSYSLCFNVNNLNIENNKITLSLIVHPKLEIKIGHLNKIVKITAYQYNDPNVYESKQTKYNLYEIGKISIIFNDFIINKPILIMFRDIGTLNCQYLIIRHQTHIENVQFVNK